jgi:hypothetical protein
MRYLLCSRTANYSEVYAIELTAPKLSERRVACIGHGAENAGETRDPQFDSHVYNGV